jgi:hypothetical protein|tara:strand:- start:2257 stop:3699 length:1443 start_codon:yes stop_codon:yes gene_type:complete
MKNKEGYIPKADRKKILLLCDDIRMHSGVATMAREFVVGSAHHYNWFNLGAAVNHPEVGKVMDLSADVNKTAKLEDASVYVQPSNGYGDTSMIRHLIKTQKPDAIFIFTDPRYWIWLFEIEREIRSKIPIVWLNIWDEYPAPMYNKNYYDSVDGLLGISKQTCNINRLVLGDKIKNKVSKYVPHGIDEDTFFPIQEGHKDFEALQEFKSNLFKGKEIEYVVFFNSRNIQRKHPGDTILAFKQFCDIIGEEKAKKVALVMKTEVSSQHGTDLRAIKETFCPELNVMFATEKLSPAQMNLLYNISDLTVLLSSNEGWGLALTESMMAGTMISANVTGGMQDQMRFENEKGEWIDFDADFPSNHRGTYKKHGEWAIPIWPTNMSMMGSPLTPYIYDDRCMPEDAAKTMLQAYELGREERNKKGLKGREWARSKEAGFTGKMMSNNIIKGIDETIDNFEPRPLYEIKKIENYSQDRITHKLTGY